MKVFEKLESFDVSEKLEQNSSAISDLFVVFSFVCLVRSVCVFGGIGHKSF